MMIISLCLFMAQVFVVNGLFGSKKGDENAPMYHVGIRLTGWKTPACGGVVLADNWIATSAYCALHPSTLTEFEGIVGTKVLGKAKKSNIIRFESVTLTGEVALLRTQESLLSLGATSVTLSSSSPSSSGVISNYVEQEETLADVFSSNKKDILTEIQLDLAENERCKGLNPSNQFCAVNPNPDNENACIGQQGAPFVIGSVLYGIRKDSCFTSKTPAIFIDVSKYSDAIKAIIHA